MKLIIKIIFAIFLFPILSYSQVDLSGEIINEKNHPLEGVTIQSKMLGVTWVSDALGKFRISIKPIDTLVFKSIGYEEYRISVIDFPKSGTIILKSEDMLIESIEVVHTGFQNVRKDQVTGSVNFIPEELLNRTSGLTILSRLEGLSPGLQFNKGLASETDAFLIRGRNTFTADSQPLIVLDDFPYEGDLNSINPEDVASVTILKDAAATSLWGARAANGVIVIKSKEGGGTKRKIEIKTDMALEKRPDIYNLKWINSTELIEFEKKRFEEGAYDNYLQGPYYDKSITPVLELLFENRKNPNDESLIRIEEFKNKDVRKDISKHLYRNSIGTQNHIGISGNTNQLNYMVSAGFYDYSTTLKGENHNRLTLRTNNTYKISSFMDIQQYLQYTKTAKNAGENPGYLIRGIYPYASLVDDKGLPSNLYLDYPKAYLDTLGGGELLDWTYNPVRDLNTVENNEHYNNITTGVNINVKPTRNINFSLRYQYQHGKTDNENNRGAESYYTRMLINRFSFYENNQWNRPIPIGGILDYTNKTHISHQGRIQIDYSKKWNKGLSLDAIGGYEIRNKIESGRSGGIYGYSPERASTIPTIDYVNNYTLLTTGTSSKISPIGSVFKRTDNFLSWYGTGTLGFQDIIFLSASTRKDQANLFGVATNAKGSPFWSLGAKLELSKLSALENLITDHLSVRFTYGVNGNVSRSASAETTIQYVNYARTGLTSAILNTPPNKHLKWERVLSKNWGVDFSLLSGYIYGSIDYYHKDSRDLLAESPLDPTLGMNSFFGNVGSMNGKGFELILTSLNLKNPIYWTSTLNLSYTQAKVSEYLMPVSNVPTVYLSGTTVAPIVGKPLYALFSYPWAGLDSQNGDPLGYLNNEISKDYQSITQGTRINEMIFNGPIQSPWYGSFRNDFKYKNFGLSINVGFKFGGYFRANSYNSYDLMPGFNTHSDYSQRWKKPGDEKHTQIPSFDTEGIEGRGMFYRFSDILALKSDNIRLEDILLNYQFVPSNFLKQKVNHIKVFAQIQNVNLVWLKNEKNIDPYYNDIPRQGVSLITGIKVVF